jgi:hypothetical protein
MPLHLLRSSNFPTYFFLFAIDWDAAKRPLRKRAE